MPSYFDGLRQALNVGQKWPHCTSQYSLHIHWRPRMTAFGLHQIQIIDFTLCRFIQPAKASVILNSVQRIGAWHPGNIHFWATFFQHWVWRNSMAVVRKYFLIKVLIRKFILKIFSRVSDAVLWLYSSRLRRDDRHKTAPSPDQLAVIINPNFKRSWIYHLIFPTNWVY